MKLGKRLVRKEKCTLKSQERMEERLPQLSNK